MAEILFDDHDHEGSHRTVRISGYFAHEIRSLDAKMYDSSVALVRFREDAAPSTFYMEAAEMDTLMEEWQNFKAARVAYLAEEKRQEQAALDEAFALAKEHGFTIRTSSGCYQPIWENGEPYTRGYVNKWDLLERVRDMVTIKAEKVTAQ